MAKKIKTPKAKQSSTYVAKKTFIEQPIARVKRKIQEREIDAYYLKQKIKRNAKIDSLRKVVYGK